jgi:hypothetical protein
VLEWSSAAGGISFVSQDNSLLVGHATAPSGTALHNVSVGLSALDSLVGGDYNTAIGSTAGTAISGGNLNTLVGYNSGVAINNGVNNTVLGAHALETGSITSQAVAIGYKAFNLLTAQFPGSVAVGYEAGKSADTGTLNTIVGYQAAADGTSAAKNTAIGYHALHADVTGQESVAVGYNALVAQVASASSLAKNVAVGSQAGLSNTEGYYNVFLGTLAGNTNTTGDSNIVIGYNAEKSSATTDNEIVIGSAGAGLGANSTVIGNTSTVNAKIFGLRTPLTATTGDTSLTANDSGETFVFTDTAATFTLPDSGGGDLTGVYFHFIVLDDTAGTKRIQCADSTNEDLIGSVLTVDTDTSDANASFATQVADEFHQITFNGTTTGRAGSKVTVTNIAADKWHVEGTLLCTGAPATPFS